MDDDAMLVRAEERDEIVLYRKVCANCVSPRGNMNWSKVSTVEQLRSALGWTRERLWDAAHANIIAGRIRVVDGGFCVWETDLYAICCLRNLNDRAGVRFTTIEEYTGALGWTEERFRLFAEVSGWDKVLLRDVFTSAPTAPQAA